MQEGNPSGPGPEATDDVELQVIQRRAPLDRSSLDGHTGRTMLTRRRRLTGIVAMAITAACALLLVAAVVVRLSRAKPAAAATAESAATSTSTPTSAATATATATSTATSTSAATPTPTPTDVPATGNLILVRPAVRGYVWVDGKKITTTTAVVACGEHQIKVGSYGHVHAVTIPCGRDLKVWH